MHAPVKAMLLAAGAGTRLRPLTYEIPKPMVPVVNRPVLCHVLDNLLRHGLKDVAINLNAHADALRGYAGDGSRWSLNIRYSQEKHLLGTAGAVKKLAGFFKNGPFFVLSGDGLSDIDLSEMLDFHKKRKSLATMAVKAVDSRFEYGVALTGAGGRIKGFLEKPSWGEVFSNKVNTGIYLFEPEILGMIPSSGIYDFGHQLWPKLLKQKKSIFAYETKSYWTDVGNLSEYRKAQSDALDGNIKLTIPGREIQKKVWVEEGAEISPKARLHSPCVIGQGARIEAHAIIGPYTVVGDRSRVGAGARLERSILWDNVEVGPGAHLSNCILGSQSRVRESIAVYEAALLNFRA
jgi:mannose-1-phosphate guanylyltransferase/phosphomannomutase